MMRPNLWHICSNSCMESSLISHIGQPSALLWSSLKLIKIPLQKHQQNRTPRCFSAAGKHAFEKIISNHISELLLNHYDPITTITSLNDLSLFTCTNTQGLSPNWQSGNQYYCEVAQRGGTQELRYDLKAAYKREWLRKP